jgi:hypothetical protein
MAAGWASRRRCCGERSSSRKAPRSSPGPWAAPCPWNSEPGTLGFTFCQVPVVYRLVDGEARVEVARRDGAARVFEGAFLDAATSREVFERRGTVARIEVAVPAAALVASLGLSVPARVPVPAPRPPADPPRRVGRFTRRMRRRLDPIRWRRRPPTRRRRRARERPDGPRSGRRFDAPPTLLARMTLREKIGQMTQAEKNSVTPDEVRRHALGSVISGGGGNPEPNTPAAWRDMVLGLPARGGGEPASASRCSTASTPSTATTTWSARRSSPTTSASAPSATPTSCAASAAPPRSSWSRPACAGTSPRPSACPSTCAGAAPTRATGRTPSWSAASRPPTSRACAATAGTPRTPCCRR